ncbi:hypothetical protein ATKI12_7148 [Kitasatospora sp. Ki12]
MAGRCPRVGVGLVVDAKTGSYSWDGLPCVIAACLFVVVAVQSWRPRRP